jgi:hypothetical protein
MAEHAPRGDHVSGGITDTGIAEVDDRAEPAAVTGAGAAAGALRRFRDYLQPGGAFVSSFAFEWRPGDPLDTGWELLFERPGPEDGAIVRAWNREWREPASQVWHTEQRFEIEVGGKVVESQHHRRSPEGRWYTQAPAADG